MSSGTMCCFRLNAALCTDWPARCTPGCHECAKVATAAPILVPMLASQLGETYTHFSATLQGRRHHVTSGPALVCRPCRHCLRMHGKVLAYVPACIQAQAGIKSHHMPHGG